MVRIIPPDEADHSLAAVQPQADFDAGADNAPFGALTPTAFELLNYDLFSQLRVGGLDYDEAVLMITGADRGRDIMLTRDGVSVGLVQCKRAAQGFCAPDAVREIIKFLLFAELDPELLPDRASFTYHLAVAADPAGTTVDFFARPGAWLARNDARIGGDVASVVSRYASFAQIDPAALIPAIKAGLAALSYKLIRPADLDAMLDAAPSVRRRFFRSRLVIDADEARRAIGEAFEARLGPTLSAPPPIPLDPGLAQADLALGSTALAAWPRTIWGRHIARPELAELTEAIDEEPAGSTLVIGGAGTGKSALLAELYALLRARGRQVMAIKADSLDPSIRDLGDLSRDLGLTSRIDEDLGLLAAKTPVVLLIDQLDAVSEVMDQSSERMRVLLELATRLRTAKGPDGKPIPIHIIVSSRPFEARFDARFRQLEAAEVELSLPAWSDVETLLASLEIAPDAVPATLRETLRTPFALGLFVDLVKTGEPPSGLTAGNLLDRWLDKKLPHGRARAPFLAFLRRLARDMTDHETLWRPAAGYEPEHSAMVRAAESIGLIARDGASIGFAHQSWLDDFQARAFASGDDLASFAWSRQDGLFARGTVLRGLEHLRRNDQPAYERALHLLLLDDRTRRHLRHLAVDVIASGQSPSAREVAWVEWLIRNDRPLANRAISTIAASWRHWRHGLCPLLPLLMQDEQRRWQAVLLLTKEGEEDPDAVLDLVELYWPDPDRDAEAISIFERVPLASPRAIDRARMIYGRTPVGHWAVSHYASSLADAGHVEPAIRLVAAWAGTVSPGRHAVLSIHGLDGIAAKSTLLFAETFLPWFVGIAGRETWSGAAGRDYPRSQSLPFDWKYERGQGGLPEALRATLAQLAAEAPDSVRPLLAAHHSAEIDEVQSLIADTYAENPAAFHEDALAYLLADRRRLHLGVDTLDDEDGVGHMISGWSSRNLVGRISPLLDQGGLEALRDHIEGWEAYRPETGDTGQYRLKHRHWSEDERLGLLARLPAAILAPRRRRQVAEWVARQPRLEERPRGLGMAKFVGSPMSHQQMAKAADADILRLLDELHDTSRRNDSIRSFLHGGVLELSRAFGEFAKAEPDRAIAMIRGHLAPGRHEQAAGSAIRELAPLEAQDPAAIKALIWDLHEKGFDSEEWRHDAASAMEAIANRMAGLEDRDLNLLRSWLVRDAGLLAERAEANRRNRNENHERNTKPDQPPSAFLFARGGGIRTVPQQNFTILSAIAAGLLGRDKPDCDGWLNELERHLEQPEDPGIWSSLIIMRSRPLRWADESRTGAFLDRLWQCFPAAFDDPEIVGPLWRLRPRLGAGLEADLLAFWRNHVDPRLRQVAGEFAGACAIQKAPGPERAAEVDAMINGTDTNHRIGLLFSATVGWHEEDLGIRKRSHDLMMAAAPKVAGFEAQAFSTLVAGDRRFPPDGQTREMLAAIMNNPELLGASTGMYFVQSLQGLLVYPGFDELVVEVAERMASLEIGSPERSAGGLYDGELVGLAVTLQRSPACVRERAMNLYERLLDADVRGAEDAAKAALRR